MAEAEEPDYLNLAAKCFEKDKRAVLALLTKVKELAKKEKSSINWNAIVPDVLEYLEGESAEMWSQTFAPLVAGSVANAGDFWSVELGVRFDVRNLEAEKWFQEYMLTFAQPITETTADNITELLGLGMADGLTIQQMQKVISEEFEQWARGTADPEVFHFYNTRVPPYRAEMIARTESIRAMNAGSSALFERWGVKRKEWSAASDARTRDTHRAADGQVVDIDKPFNVGGSSMMYPGDGSMGAPAKEIINCRCSSLPVVEDDEVLKGDAPEISNENRTILKDGAQFRDIDGSEEFFKEWEARAKLLEQSNPEAYHSLNQYTGTYYRKINKYLRTGEGDDVTIAKVDQIRNSMVPIGDNVVTWRAVSDWKNLFPELDSIENVVGIGFTDQGFMSTAINRREPDDIIARSEGDRQVILRMEVDNQTRGFFVEPMTRNKGENELLLEDGTSWIAVGISQEQIGENQASVITIRRVR